MVNGGKREGAGRKAGSIGFSTQQQIKRLNAILTFEQYKEIVDNLIRIATSGKDREAVAAAKLIIERVEGAVPKEIVLRRDKEKTIADLLEDNE